MDPFGHHHHHHHHRPESDPDHGPYPYPPPSQRPYPPPSQRPYPPPTHNPYGEYQPPPPPPQPFHGGGGGSADYYPPPVHHVSHEYKPPPPPGPHDYYPPPVHHVSHEYSPPRPPGPHNHYVPPVEHVGHEVRPFGGFENQELPHHQHRPGFFPSPGTSVEHVSHVSHGGGPGPEELPRQRTVRVYTKAAEGFSLSIREGNVVLVPSNPRDEFQHWIKDLRYSTRVKDEEGQPSFALINKATGQAIKHAIKATHPVRLVPYNPNYLDESVLWAESKDTGEGFRCIRMVNNICLNFDAFHGDEDHGGVRDGTTVVLWEWLKGKNQRWKIVPY